MGSNHSRSGWRDARRMAAMGSVADTPKCLGHARSAPENGRQARHKIQPTEPLLIDLANSGSRFDTRLALHMVHTSPFTEGAFRRRSVAERGWRRLQARFAASSQEARSPPDPDEGCALNGWTGL